MTEKDSQVGSKLSFFPTRRRSNLKPFTRAGTKFAALWAQVAEGNGANMAVRGDYTIDWEQHGVFKAHGSS